MTLQDLYNDKELLKAVRDYFTSFLQDEAVRLLFESDKLEDDILRSLPLTQNAIDAAFDHLDLVFSPKKKNSDEVINNPAR